MRHNAGEFTSKTFDDYCMSIGVEVEHHVPHVHTQNGLAEAFIKCLEMIAQSLVIRTKLLIVAYTYQAPDPCLRPCNIARSKVGSPEACCDITIQCPSVGYRIRTRHIASTRFLLCGICADLAAFTYKNRASAKDGNLCRI
ncbi:hypothetical protein ACFX14_040074 [Malus domestica]